MEINNSSKSCKKYFTMSFDDGVEQDKRIIALMKQYGIKGTFNLSAGLFGKMHRLARINKIPKDEVCQVYEGFEVASHGYKHEMFRYMTKAKIEASLAQDIQELSDIMGYQVVGHAYPYDMHTRAGEEYLRNNRMLYARKVLGKGLKFHFPDNPHKYIATCHFNAKNILNLFEQFVKAEPVDKNLLFMTWGHGYELDTGFRPCPEPQLERIFEKIARHKDIVYCASREAFEANAGMK